MGFLLSNLLGDPFAISTVSFGMIAWIISLAGAAANPSATYLRFTWWGLVYELMLILIILVLYLYNTIELYKFTLVGLLAVATVYTTNSVNTLIYNSNNAGNLCCAAGCILLSMLNILWMVYFGGHPESPTNQFIDSFSVKASPFTHGQIPSSANKMEDSDFVSGARPAFNSYLNNESRHSQLTANANNNMNGNNKSNYMLSSQLNGLENFSSSHINDNARNTFYKAEPANEDFNLPATTYRYKAKALYNYEANPEDINEISFQKDEILEVDDIDGKWWQAKRSNGQVGICPSNYVKLMD
ncbi:hypothetical protein PUMCH_002220 [Australozyma saopauloensis]|uniref:High osmolarity signaling protein SHO1 n=1 Tax=Australozyma saopauloensis TaxID=291208 RepID=A0AAX4H9H2_9ASCO|nr:hypothetical protein PUMCH_002220 [[Candida] saopauloensis]